jgi:hypothetical protein
VTDCVRSAVAFDAGRRYQRAYNDQFAAGELMHRQWTPMQRDYATNAIRWANAVRCMFAGHEEAIDAKSFCAAREGASDFANIWIHLCGLPLTPAVRLLNEAVMHVPAAIDPEIRASMSLTVAAHRQRRTRVTATLGTKELRGPVAIRLLEIRNSIHREEQDLESTRDHLGSLRSMAEDPRVGFARTKPSGIRIAKMYAKRAREDHSLFLALARKDPPELEKPWADLAAITRAKMAIADEELAYWTGDCDSQD